VDFIDMKLRKISEKLMEKMDEFMRPDRAKHPCYPFQNFGLMQITRKG
jgi:ribonuclease G